MARSGQVKQSPSLNPSPIPTCHVVEDDSATSPAIGQTPRPSPNPTPSSPTPSPARFTTGSPRARNPGQEEARRELKLPNPSSSDAGIGAGISDPDMLMEEMAEVGAAEEAAMAEVAEEEEEEEVRERLLDWGWDLEREPPPTGTSRRVPPWVQ
eukprot:TRINITY_DN32339_c0_g1_i1.p2 TRINITY_DN32339_c0_g1~~TRINITY_DN32339_c0_g1_i1.p2  ORF type:complete len:154 (-),score=29.15 TRINITY_DN32339_c0_g1_i1:26-487(-)